MADFHNLFAWRTDRSAQYQCYSEYVRGHTVDTCHDVRLIDRCCKVSHRYIHGKVPDRLILHHLSHVGDPDGRSSPRSCFIVSDGPFVVKANPDTCDMFRSIANEPGIPGVIGCARLSGCGRPRAFALCPVPS
jgi:hypothetical protein